MVKCARDIKTCPEMYQWRWVSVPLRLARVCVNIFDIKHIFLSENAIIKGSQYSKTFKFQELSQLYLCICMNYVVLWLCNVIVILLWVNDIFDNTDYISFLPDARKHPHVRTAYLAHSATSEAICITTVIFVIDYLRFDETCILKVKIYIYVYVR